ncbi:uncharacterized protein LOC144119153 [Amblyomma americanum]
MTHSRDSRPLISKGIFRGRRAPLRKRVFSVFKRKRASTQEGKSKDAEALGAIEQLSDLFLGVVPMAALDTNDRESASEDPSSWPKLRVCLVVVMAVLLLLVLATLIIRLARYDSTHANNARDIKSSWVPVRPRTSTSVIPAGEEVVPMAGRGEPEVNNIGGEEDGREALPQNTESPSHDNATNSTIFTMRLDTESPAPSP